MEVKVVVFKGLLYLEVERKDLFILEDLRDEPKT